MEIKQASFTLSILGCTSADVQSEMNHLKLVYSLYNPGCAIEILDTFDSLVTMSNDDVVLVLKGTGRGRVSSCSGRVRGRRPSSPPPPGGSPSPGLMWSTSMTRPRRRWKRRRRAGWVPELFVLGHNFHPKTIFVSLQIIIFFENFRWSSIQVYLIFYLTVDTTLEPTYFILDEAHGNLCVL
jgi:hypothetical protein